MDGNLVAAFRFCWGGVASAAIGVLCAGGCDPDASDDLARTQEAIEPTTDLPPGYEYHPEYNRIGGLAQLELVTDEDVANRRAANHAAAEHRVSPAGWRERVAPIVTSQTLVVVARLVEDRGSKYGPHSHTALVEIVEHIAGPAPPVDPIEVVQPGSDGPSLEGLHWQAGINAAVLLGPPGANGTRRILVLNGTAGWAVQTGPDSFQSNNAYVDRATLESLGDAL